MFCSVPALQENHIRKFKKVKDRNGFHDPIGAFRRKADYKHGLPESAHSSTAYIKLDHNGVFREMRFYDKNHVLYLEIGYHPEKSLTGNRHTPILHYHTYDPLFSKTKLGGKLRSDAVKLPGGMKKKLHKYFKGVKL